MSESFENKSVPSWQDISLEDIAILINKGEIKKAVIFASLRYDGIKNMPTEIDDATQQEKSADVENWHSHKEAFEEEIAELERILNLYKQ